MMSLLGRFLENVLHIHCDTPPCLLHHRMFVPCTMLGPIGHAAMIVRSDHKLLCPCSFHNVWSLLIFNRLSRSGQQGRFLPSSKYLLLHLRRYHKNPLPSFICSTNVFWIYFLIQRSNSFGDVFDMLHYEHMLPYVFAGLCHQHRYVDHLEPWNCPYCGSPP